MKPFLFKFFSVALLTVWSAVALSSEVWSGYATLQNRGSDFPVYIKLTIDQAPTDPTSYTGSIEISGSMLRCGGETELQFLKISDGSVQIKSKPLKTHDCGSFVFKGIVVDGAWVGKFPWNGKSNELTLKK